MYDIGRPSTKKKIKQKEHEGVIKEEEDEEEDKELSQMKKARISNISIKYFKFKKI